MHAPNLANSSLHESLWTSVYVARIHLPYVDAAAEQVVVEWRANWRRGLAAVVVAGFIVWGVPVQAG